MGLFFSKLSTKAWAFIVLGLFFIFLTLFILVNDLDDALRKEHFNTNEKWIEKLSAELLEPAGDFTWPIGQVMKGSILLDGDLSDWDSVLGPRLTHQSKELLADIQFAENQQHELFLMLEVRDLTPHYEPLRYSNSQNQFDKIILSLEHANGEIFKYQLSIHKPGIVVAERLNRESKPLRFESNIRGVWAQKKGGYILEISLGSTHLWTEMGIELIDATSLSTAVKEIFFPIGSKRELQYPFNKRLSEWILELRRYEKFLGLGEYFSVVTKKSSVLIEEASDESFIFLPENLFGLVAVSVVPGKQSSHPAVKYILKMRFFLWILLGLVLLAILFQWKIYRELSMPIQSILSLYEKNLLTGQASWHKFDLPRKVSIVLELLQRRLEQYHNYLLKMTSRLASELKSPINHLKNNLMRLEEENLTLPARLLTEQSLENAKRLREMTERIEEVTRLEYLIQFSEPEDCNVIKIVQKMVIDQQRIDRSHHYQVNCKEDVLSMLINQELLQKLLGKILENAAEFSRPGTIITIYVALLLDKILIKVVNVGNHLPGDMVNAIFDPMITLREPRGEQFHLGLGLFIAKTIVEHYHGTIKAENIDDPDGVAITVSLPSNWSLG